ncbi:glycosyltransferase [Cryobacterium sp. PAMC25264]|uniref:glycosyltransferase n=1 Tax=Cryobacterium sp. PAMC25264 TaxID=2861288 RepID=UPI001C62A547|nr:glycosyltransferase [Cryobacterium sp. PAMC25264]QYF73735.1 glycosyltransferase family 4 protein [Cryobacterium sp. PAMC25264]
MSISWFVPYSGIDHAGGELLRRHLQALLHDYEVALFAPDEGHNLTPGDTHDPESVSVFKLGGTILSHKWMRPARKTLSFLKGATLGSDFELAAHRSRVLKNHLRAASVVEFQWIESASLAGWVRRIAPTAKQVLIVHDLNSQRWARLIEHEPKRSRRMVARVRAWLSNRTEARVLRSVDHIVVLSDKDRDLVKAVCERATVSVINPPLGVEGTETRAVVTPASSASRVLFVGAFGRPENSEGALWLIKEVWERVRRQVPDATLILAGSKPPPWLVDAAESSEGVLVTGYVDDLSPYFKQADVFVAPLFRGAGVKFKTITAMLHCVPVVSTTVGAEGISNASSYVSIVNDADGFADGIISGLTNMAAREAAVKSAFQWCEGRFGEEKFADVIGQLYHRIEQSSR